MDFNDKAVVSKQDAIFDASELLFAELPETSRNTDKNANGLLDNLELSDLTVSPESSTGLENKEKDIYWDRPVQSSGFRYLTGIEVTAIVSIAAFAFGRLSVKHEQKKDKEQTEKNVAEITDQSNLSDLSNLSVQTVQTERKNTNTAVVCTIDPRLNFSRLSNNVADAWGYDLQELNGRSFLTFIANENVQSTLLALREIIHNKSGLAFENKMRRKDGQWMHLAWSAYWSEHDKQIIGIAHDITNDKTREQKRQEAVQMVSHDLRSPLTSIQFSLELLAAGASGQLPDEALQDVVIAQNSTSQLINLVNDLLDLEKLEHGSLTLHPKKVVLADILQPALDSVRFLARRKKIEMKIENTDLAVVADKERIVQVLINILSNAINFAPEQSTVELSSRIDKGFIEVRIADRGPGIPAQYHQEIFERFRQVSPAEGSLRKGSGLGLAICKSIIEGHHGTIGVDSQEGQGSTFWFKLPAADVLPLNEQVNQASA